MFEVRVIRIPLLECISSENIAKFFPLIDGKLIDQNIRIIEDEAVLVLFFQKNNQKIDSSFLAKDVIVWLTRYYKFKKEKSKKEG